ncbi:MAG: FecR family protein, partial [Gammaproteobacteria bacterium]
PTQTFATTDAVVGTAMIRAAGDADWSWLDPEQTVTLTSGIRLRTGPASAAGLLLQDGGSLRIDARSEIEFQPDGRILLSAGAVYFDSGAVDAEANPLEIVTPDSRVRHLGTQFEVRHEKPGSRIRVREGRVLISTRLKDFETGAGDELTVLAQGSVQRASIAADDPGWDWVQTVAPAIYAEDQPLSALLDWVARETGRQVYFARPELELRAARTILHGSARRLMPMEALAVMLQTTDFHYLVTGGNEILIDAGSP